MISAIEMFSSAFVMSALSFGGGYITLPMLRKNFIEKRQLITEEKLQDIAAIAQSSPGSISVSLASGVAYEIGGFYLMLITFLGSILPPFLIISLVSYFYDFFMMNHYIQSIFKGLEIGVAVIMVILLKDMTYILYKRDDKTSIILLIVGIIINFILKTHLVFILIFNLVFVFLIKGVSKNETS